MTFVRAAALVSTLSLPIAATAAASPAGVARNGAADPTDPDDLYRHREDITDAERAADLWAAHATTDYAAAWKLARACYWIGTKGPAAGRRAALSRGIEAAKGAVKLSPTSPEGHFWLAADMGALAETGGIIQGLKYRGDIRSELERVMAIEPDWQDGSAEAALGRWYFEVPGWGFGGSHTKAKELLREDISKHPDSQTALSFLADVLIDEGKKDEAAALLERVIAAPVDPDWAPEHEDYVRDATAKLKKLRSR